MLCDLHDIELALEEQQGAIWYMAICAQCDHRPMKYDKETERAEWARDHIDDTGHIVVRFEAPR